MKDIIKNIKQHCENTGKASFELVKTSQQIVDLIQKNNQLMKGITTPAKLMGFPSDRELFLTSMSVGKKGVNPRFIQIHTVILITILKKNMSMYI